MWGGRPLRIEALEVQRADPACAPVRARALPAVKPTGRRPAARQLPRGLAAPDGLQSDDLGPPQVPDHVGHSAQQSEELREPGLLCSSEPAQQQAAPRVLTAVPGLFPLPPLRFPRPAVRRARTAPLAPQQLEWVPRGSDGPPRRRRRRRRLRNLQRGHPRELLNSSLLLDRQRISNCRAPSFGATTARIQCESVENPPAEDPAAPAGDSPCPPGRTAGVQPCRTPSILGSATGTDIAPIL
jgi:hypothetical protein